MEPNAAAPRGDPVGRTVTAAAEHPQLADDGERVRHQQPPAGVEQILPGDELGGAQTLGVARSVAEHLGDRISTSVQCRLIRHYEKVKYFHYAVMGVSLSNSSLYNLISMFLSCSFFSATSTVKLFSLAELRRENLKVAATGSVCLSQR